MAEDLNWDYREQIQLAVRAGLKLGASDLQVQRSNHSATQPPLTVLFVWIILGYLHFCCFAKYSTLN